MKSRAVIEDDPVLFVRNQKKKQNKKERLPLEPDRRELLQTSTRRRR